MHLKRLETVGFKSFADRIEIDFVPGVTAVVGPNGSGKSNITDAIRWVLGEQSVRSLRGARMEDIIFQGSDTRNPLNVAEVTLVLDNSDQTLPLDYEEVSVTRRVYRSGASEFYINKQSCRLKDIVDLFMDSGLGREAFSIISQGKVEEILSSKEEERRVIFEEAAGVLKYKQRKEKAQFKLAETEENLFRVDDIIYEIEQQIDPLREQSKVAERYLKKRKQLKKHEISLLITEIDQLHSEWEKLLKEIEVEKDEGLKKKSQINTLEAKIEKGRAQVQRLDAEIDELQESLLSTTQMLEQQEGQKKVAFERSKHFVDNKKALEKQKVSLQEQIDDLSTQYEEEKSHLNTLKEKRNEKQTTINQLNEKLSTEVETIKEKIEDLKAEYIDYLNEQAAKRNELQTTNRRLTQFHETKSKNNKKNETYEKNRQILKEKFETIAHKTAQLEKSYKEKLNQLQNYQQKIKNKEENLIQSEQKLNEGYQMIARLHSRKEVLQEMKEEFQGFYYGVRSILQAKERREVKDIYGAVVELIDVPEQYIYAIETVLGGQSQNLVVKDEQSARRAINYLRKTNNGRATFLPIETIQPRFIPENLLAKVKGHPGYVDIVANIVQTDEKFIPVIRHLMGNVVLAKTIKDANEIAKLLQRKFRIVTLEGDIVYPGGSMSGGAKRKSKQSLFTREKELEKTIEKLTNFEKRAAKFKEQIQTEKQLVRQMEADTEKLSQKVEQKYSELQQSRTNYETVKLQLSNLEEQIGVFTFEQNQLVEDEQQYMMQKKNVTEKLARIEKHLNDMQEEIEELTKRQTEFEQNREQILQQVHQLEISLAEVDERYKNQRTKTEGIALQLTKVKQAYENVKIDLQELIENHAKEATVEEIAEDIMKLQEKNDELTETIRKKRAHRLELTKTLDSEEREVREQNKIYERFMQKLQQKEVKSNRLDVELENRLSQLQTDYTISYERAKETYEKTDDQEATEKIVQQLKQEIKSLGRVNLGAIDEYKRISERYEFLTEQKEDLEQAKQSLFNIIAEMDEEMKARFEETFTLIRREFSIVFKELFGGGHAELNLTDPDDLLETGIEIIAQPPGKKLQQLDLLSGGERALTAISLLFAILRVRPVPFCVLDEVEAALDETNVVRFAEYVKIHSDETQFIVITHRKGTMEEADVLYGVTMQESGVSRLVSVRLEEADELVEA